MALTSLNASVSLAAVLRDRAAETADRGYVFLGDGQAETSQLTFRELDRRARGIAAWLGRTVLPGDRALLLFPPGLDFIAAFFGCLYSGVIAVPAQPPSLRKDVSRFRSIVRDATPRAILATETIGSRVAAEAAGQGGDGMPALPWLAVDDFATDLAEEWRHCRVGPDAVAFLQYTSGSTGEPKGVAVTHGNLIHNEAAIRHVFDQDRDSVIVGWLPLYHDMGLIGNVLQPLWLGARCILMSPVSFLQRPRRWLDAISGYRATTSGGPNFAYDLCVRRIPPAEREGLDLTSWAVAFNGAEPVRSETQERFAKAFAPHGFSPRAFCPCYGLAEATLLVAGVHRGAVPRTLALDAAALGRNQVAAAGGGTAPVLVEGGEPLPDQRLVIVDPESATPCPPERVGEIWVAGASVAQGYWQRPEESAATFGARLAGGEGPFLRTGDLGFVDGSGALFVTGRLKDLIILRGRNLYPQDIERTLEGCHPALRPGCAAAFGVDAGGEERLVVVQELDPRTRTVDAPVVEAITEAVRRAVAQEHEVQVYDVVLIAAGSLPKTTSGKVRRRECRRLLLEGRLEVLARSALAQEGGVAEAAEPAAVLPAAALRAVDYAERRAVLERSLCERLAGALGLASEAVEPRQPLTALGLDSLAAVELRYWLEAGFGWAPPLASLLQGASVESLAAELCLHLEEPPVQGGVPLAATGGELGDHGASDGQKALWFLERLAPGNGAYHIGGSARTPGTLDRLALQRALGSLAVRHPALRTVLTVADGEVRQRVLAAGPDTAPELRHEETAAWSAAELAQRIEEVIAQPFDLERGPLWRAAVFAGPGETVVVLAMHHIVSDFWSLGVLVRELGLLYRQETAGTPAGLAPLPLRFSDFARWQERWLASPEGDRARVDREERLAGVADLDLPLDRPRPAAQSHRGGLRRLRIGGDATAAIQALAQRRGATLFMTLLAGFQALLCRYSGQEDFAVGSPVLGRPAAALAGVVGYFANPLALRADLTGEPPFGNLLARVREEALAAFAHQDLPFSRLAERLGPQRDPARSPVFQTMLVLHRAERLGEEALAAWALGEGGERLDLAGLVLESLPRDSRPAQLELTLHAARLSGGLGLALEHNADLFDGATADRLLAHCANLLRAAAAAPDTEVGRLPLLAPEESAELLAGGNRSVAEPPGTLLHELFLEQVRRTPDAVALIAGEERLTYRDLDRRSSALAHRLRGLGVGPEVRAALATGRTSGMVAGLLAILRAGGAYVPLDPAYPRERLAFTLADSAAAVLITEAHVEPLLPPFAGPVLRLGDPLPSVPADAPPCGAGAGNLAYLIYTSGSTGRPKAVAIEHRSPVALVRWAREVFAPAELAGVLAATSICFDLSVFELFVPLSWGGTVILAENALALPRLPAAAEVTLVNTVPSAMAELAQGALPAAVRTVCLAGEPLLAPLVRQIEALGTVERVLNLYGPSEDTTYSTWAEVRGEERAPTIGVPVRGTRAHVARLAGGGEPVPPGVVGELVLGGAGLARGYLARPDLTAERFVPDPWGDLFGEPGGRLYRTGDLARRLPGGRLDFLGRADQQVKIRGHRVELGEIESVLLRHPAVRQAAVLVRRDGPGGEPRLVAYAGAPVPEAGAALPRELAELSRGALPAAMQPAAFVVLPELPLTPNGKIDRKALLAPEPAAGEAPGGGAARTETEEVLAGILAAALGRESVGREDDFFALGGHSLLAVRALTRIERAFGLELPLAALFQTPTVAGLAARLAGRRGAAAAGAAPPLVRLPRDGGGLPLSFAQQRLWFLHQLDAGSAAYNIPGAVCLEGPLSVPALAAAVAGIVRRHETLRARFHAVAGEPVQEIAPPEPPRLEQVDLAALPAPARDREARRLAAAVACRPFDLARGPLLRHLLLRLAAGEHRLVVVLHHIVADGASLEIFLRELATWYTALAAGGPAPQPELPVQYADYAAWQHRAFAGEAPAAALAWWKAELAGAPVIELPADRPRRPAVGDRGGSHPFDLAAVAPPAALRSLGRAAGVTPYMTLLAAFAILLHRLTGQTDVPVGSPVATRERAETEEMIGLLINTVVLRTGLGGDPPAGELLQRVRRTVLAAHAHAAVPFERVVDELQPERSLQHSPLFQVMLAYLRAASAGEVAGGLSLRFTAVDTGTSKFDLSLWVRETAEGMEGRLVFRSELFDSATVARWAGSLSALLRGLVEDPSRRLAELPLLSLAERHQLAVEWNATAAPYADGRCLHELFAGQAAGRPEAAALIGPEGALSFAEVARRSDRMAGVLRGLGVGPDVLVGVCADRSPEMVMAILAVWKAGGAYLPLDPSYPADRVAWMMADAAAPVLITRPALLAAPPGVATVALDLLAAPAVPGAEAAMEPAGTGPAADPDNLAYVLYTSGSTGRPKGVMIRHRSVAHLAAALESSVYAGAGGRSRRVGVNASLAFDASVKQLVQLVQGRALCVLPDEVRRDGALLLSFLREQRLDAVDCTPSQVRLVVGEAGAAAGAPAPLVLVGGEAIGEALWRELAAMSEAAGTEIWNVYGPTECTVDATACRIDGERPQLGRPIANVRIHLLDGALCPVPVGVSGELCIAGAGLARGYWRRPDLSALRFVPDPFAAGPGERLYRSGDLARRLPDGRLEFLGRVDRQVKVRGHRIELEEVEALLAAHPAVERAVAAVCEGGAGEARLVAYTTGPGEVSEAELRAFLRRSQPEAMVPSAFVRLDRFPLTANGKVDRRALPDPGRVALSGGEPAAPRTPLEARLAALLADLLRRPAVGAHDNFFDIGGHSLLAAQLISRVRSALGVEVPLRDLFEAPTIAGLAAAVEAIQARGAAAGAAPTAPIQARPRGQRGLEQLVSELGRITPEQARERLRAGGTPPRRGA
jgi:amino acid adenylation domain-containing protein